VDKSKKKDAVKKVIAAMTVGKDVSSLFPGGCGSRWLVTGGGRCCSGCCVYSRGGGAATNMSPLASGPFKVVPARPPACLPASAGLWVTFAAPSCSHRPSSLAHLLCGHLHYLRHCHATYPPCCLPADVINQMQTDDMELKKLVYLYLINYAKTQPDLAIMAVNTFVKASRAERPEACLAWLALGRQGGSAKRCRCFLSVCTPHAHNCDTQLGLSLACPLTTHALACQPAHLPICAGLPGP